MFLIIQLKYLLKLLTIQQFHSLYCLSQDRKMYQLKTKISYFPLFSICHTCLFKFSTTTINNFFGSFIQIFLTILLSMEDD